MKKVLFFFALVLTLTSCEQFKSILDDEEKRPSPPEPELANCYNSKTPRSPYVYDPNGNVESIELPKGCEIEGLSWNIRKIYLSYKLPDGSYAWFLAEAAIVMPTDTIDETSVEGHTFSCSEGKFNYASSTGATARGWFGSNGNLSWGTPGEKESKDKVSEYETHITEAVYMCLRINGEDGDEIEIEFPFTIRKGW